MRPQGFRGGVSGHEVLLGAGSLCRIYADAVQPSQTLARSASKFCHAGLFQVMQQGRTRFCGWNFCKLLQITVFHFERLATCCVLAGQKLQNIAIVHAALCCLLSIASVSCRVATAAVNAFEIVQSWTCTRMSVDAVGRGAMWILAAKLYCTARRDSCR